MNNKILIGVIIVVIIIGGAVVLLNNKAQTSTSTNAPTSSTGSTNNQAGPSSTANQGQTTVTLTADDGFSPSTLTIKAGTKVTWVNNSGEDATINSNPHPTHTDYPPLNLGAFSNGQSLSLTFDKPGTYGYHNHFNPSQKGTIIVQ